MWGDHNNIITFNTPYLKYSPISYAHSYYLMLVLLTVFRYHFGTFDTKHWWCLLLIQLFRDHSGTIWRMKCTGCQHFNWYLRYFGLWSSREQQRGGDADAFYQPLLVSFSHFCRYHFLHLPSIYFGRDVTSRFQIHSKLIALYI